MKKLILVILLTLLLATPVIADKVSVSSWEELSDAITADERTITLTQDISTDSAGDEGLIISGNITITSDYKTIDVSQSGRVFTIDGGNLTLCDVNLTNATNSAVMIYDGNFTMDGGSITNCTSEQGGGVCVMYGEFIMIDGNITDCSANYIGDGVMVYLDGTMTMSGGYVNSVYVSGKLNLKNTPVIEELYLESDDSLTVIDEISSPAEIHITHPLSGKFGTILVDSDLSCFIAENLEAVRTGNDLNWMTAYNITVSTEGITASKSKSRAGVEIGLTITPEYGYELDTLSVENPFIMPEEDVIVSGTFKPVKVPVTFDGVGIIEQTYGSRYVLPTTPSKSGYNFVGWFDGDTQISYVTKAEAHTVYARWSAVPQKQSASSSKGTSIWLPSTITPTPTPVPTVVQPTVIPVKEVTTTPVPILGLILGLLFVMRRKW